MPKAPSRSARPSVAAVSTAVTTAVRWMDRAPSSPTGSSRLSGWSGAHRNRITRSVMDTVTVASSTTTRIAGAAGCEGRRMAYPSSRPTRNAVTHIDECRDCERRGTGLCRRTSGPESGNSRRAVSRAAVPTANRNRIERTSLAGPTAASRPFGRAKASTIARWHPRKGGSHGIDPVRIGRLAARLPSGRVWSLPIRPAAAGARRRAVPSHS